MDELTLQHQSDCCFFFFFPPLVFVTQLNLLIHFACKPICLSSRSQTVSCPLTVPCPLLLFVSVSLLCLSFSLNDKAISRAPAPGEIEGISVHTFIPPPPPLPPSPPSFSPTVASYPPSLSLQLLSLSKCL